ADFDCPAVANAVNPSQWGYYQGPIPNPNIGWQPIAPGRTVTAVINATAPNPGSDLSTVYDKVCDVDIVGGEMCGKFVDTVGAMRQHMRSAHPGSIANGTRSNPSVAEQAAGRNALKAWVLSGG
ncbi:hypothetical protein SLS62_003100, partial [Diatrype stigma]